MDVQFLAELAELDDRIAEQVRRAGCPRCGGRLDGADYARKPRGGLIVPLAESWTRRRSLCCSREGCRRRATPPSVRFLGRKVYAEVVVVLACVHASLVEKARAASAHTGVPARTTRRWLTWWQTVFVASALWRDARARLVPPVDDGALPGSLLERFTAKTALVDVARLLAPITTCMAGDRSRFMRLGM